MNILDNKEKEIENKDINIDNNNVLIPKNHRNDSIMRFFIVVILCSFVFGLMGGIVSYNFLPTIENQFLNIGKIERRDTKKEESSNTSSYNSSISYEEAIINAVKETSPAVVSIIISKDVPVIEQYFFNPFKDFEDFFGPGFLIPQYRQKGTQKKEIGGGTGVIISPDGIVLTNKHVVSDENADYTIFTNDGKKFPAKVLAKDPVQDLAIIQIEDEKKLKPFKSAKLGNSDNLEIGQTVIAIGNALGELRNTVSVGVISGLGRKITASDGAAIEVLEDVIQTDAAINRGNSGGPLLNLKGEIIGINVAMAEGGQNIGFSIPINKAKRSIEQVKKTGKIIYPFLGVNYVLIDEKIQKERNLPVDYGALIVKSSSGWAVVPGSPAEKVGLKENDIVLEINNEKITVDNSLSKIVAKYNPGDKVILKVLKNKEEKIIEVVLGERS